MVATAPSNVHYLGTFNESKAHTVSSIGACKAACLADRDCVQCTWAPDHRDKCVLYQHITTKLRSLPPVQRVQAWVKCSKSDGVIVAAECGAFSQEPLLDRSLQYWSMLDFAANGSVNSLVWEDTVVIPVPSDPAHTP